MVFSESDTETKLKSYHQNLRFAQLYVKKIAKSLHIVYNMLKKVRNFDMLGDTNSGVL